MSKVLKVAAITLLVILFWTPLISTWSMIYFDNWSEEARSYWGLQAIVMGVYNAPFVIASASTILLASQSAKKMKVKTTNVLLGVSIASSILGAILMMTWTAVD